MKLGIRKIQENEWQVHIGNASIRLDRFSLELMNIALDHLQALESGQVHSVLKSYIHLAEQLLQLAPADLQVLLREIDNKDILSLLMIAENEELSQTVLNNIGGIMAKQLAGDMQSGAKPGHEEAKDAIRRVVEKMFYFEAQGMIQIQSGDERYI